MRTVLSLCLVLLMATVVLAQPPRMEWKGKVKELGDPERLEKQSNPIFDKMGLPGVHNWAGKPFPPFNSNQNKYGGPLNDGMRGWGGSPFKDFGPGHPWGRLDGSGPHGRMGGPVGPPVPFRGHDARGTHKGYKVPPFSDYNRGRWEGRGYQGGRNKDFQPPRRKLEGDIKVCPFCGVKIG